MNRDLNEEDYWARKIKSKREQQSQRPSGGNMLEELQGSGCGWREVSKDAYVQMGVPDSPVGRGHGKDSECYFKHAGQLLRAESREVITKLMFLKNVMKRL